ncbi:M14 family metallopeptidase [Streptomyces sp. UNOB3_S3]|uniref:M14 family metallopeptidase n=1 Tax=Streptomyces sp. UNOB3_S3 TaxID=2871682 RepID=UPI001E2BC50D|nr:M14 family metallopeptidase [Streptomyces sp. UNOB3_S3]MCC3773835.1 hypothetical protein [Streptomyces sp. UNOB3_S3]
MSTYFNTTEVDSAVVRLAGAYPELTRLIELPEPSVEGVTCHALGLGAAPDGNGDGHKGCVVLTGGIHAREWGSCEILVNLAADLLEAYKTGTGLAYGGARFGSAQIRDLLDNLSVIVFPLVNPDGRHYSQTVDPMWRKNRNPAHANSDPACVGVDINRNFDFLFDFTTAFDPAAGPRVSSDPCDYQTYQGPHAFSEPETRNVRWLLDTHPATRWFIDVHSYSQDMLFVWGDDENQSTDPTQNFRNADFDGKRGVAGDTAYREYLPEDDANTAATLAEQFCEGVHGVRGVRYRPMSGFHLYPTSGTSDDYTYSRHLADDGQRKVHAFTIEWGKEDPRSAEASFHPPWTEMKRIIKDVDAGLIQFCLAALQT